MSATSLPRLSRWPFLVADFCLLAVAALLFFRSAEPFGAPALLALAGCVLAGAVLSVLPWLLEYRAAVSLAESEALAARLPQIDAMEQVARQLASATSSWQSVQEQSAKTAKASEEIAGRMSEEAKSFAQFMQKTNDTEKAHLRLEVEKLRRSEGEWLQILVGTLDHVFALTQGAAQTGNTAFIQQLKRFRAACYDISRRIGLVPFIAAPDEAFDPKLHQLPEPGSESVTEGKIAETLACGYTFQGQLIRPALVRLQSATAQPVATAQETATAPITQPAKEAPAPSKETPNQPTLI